MISPSEEQVMAWLEENATMWETMASKLVAAGEPEMAASTNGEACFVRAAIALLDGALKLAKSASDGSTQSARLDVTA
jgi:hypothetical protein